MAEIINIKNEAGEVQYPVTKPECVIDENGKSVLTLIQENGTELRQEIDELSERIDNLPQGDEFDKEGNYPLLHVGTADDLAGRGESVPASFGFRASGGKSIKDGRAYIKRIKGNSVVWNQIIDESSIIENDSEIAIISNGYAVTPSGSAPGLRILSSPIIPVVGHKYLLLCDKTGGSRGLYLNWGGHNASLPNPFFTASDSSKTTISIYSYLETEPFTLTIPKLIDLTKAFPNDWQNINTIEDFYARVATLGVDLNAYNEGEVIHCNTESIKSVGDNAWDEEWELGAIDANTGEVISGDFVMPSNYIKVLPNEQYVYTDVNYLAYGELFCYDADKNYIGRSVQVRRENAILTFRTLPNCSYILFRLISSYGTTYKHDILISLYHSGWKAQKDDQYQPYWQDTLPLPIIRKYFPQGMKLAGSAHDEIRYNKASGKWEKVVRIGEVDMGSLEWKYLSQYSMFTANITDKAYGGKNLICSKYTTQEFGQSNDKAINGNYSSYQIQAFDSAYTDAASFKTAMQGVILYYELAEPIVTELDEADQNFRDYYNVADFGTEQSQSSVPSAPFSADIIYQFNAVDMIREHEIEITELQSIIATMQAQLTSLINGGQ